MKVDLTKRKVKLLIVRLASLRTELDVSREILHSAASIVDSEYEIRYTPEANEESLSTTPEKEPTQKPTQEPIQPSQDPSSNKGREKNPNSGPTQGTEDVEKTAKKHVDPEVKKLFRKISLKIHPDKLEEFPPGDIKNEKLRLYSAARTALDNNDFIRMIEIASKIEIEIPETPPSMVESVQREINSIKKQMDKIESTMVWQWFVCEDEQKKEAMLDEMLRKMYEINTGS